MDILKNFPTTPILQHIRMKQPNGRFMPCDSLSGCGLEPWGDWRQLMPILLFNKTHHPLAITDTSVLSKLPIFHAAESQKSTRAQWRLSDRNLLKDSGKRTDQETSTQIWKRHSHQNFLDFFWRWKKKYGHVRMTTTLHRFNESENSLK